jgi:pilus assembly protein CpaE
LGTESAPSALAFVLDAQSEALIQSCFADAGIAGAKVVRGSVAEATELLGHERSPQILIVDINDDADPLPGLEKLASVCEPRTNVIVIGDRNDIVLYRSLRDAGVAEYFFKPLVATVLTPMLDAMLHGRQAEHPKRKGHLVIALGVRGGVGTSTICANTAWQLAEERQRRTSVVDLDLHFGDLSMQFDVAPSHALCEALEFTDRIDDLFLERAIVRAGNRLELLESLEPLSREFYPSEDAVLTLVGILLERSRYVFIDLPAFIATRYPKLLHMPGTVFLISDATLVAARDVVRWRAFLGANSSKRNVVHVLNKAGAPGALSEDQMVRALGRAPDLEIPYDREVAAAASLGVQQVRRSATVKRGIASIFHLLTGEAEEKKTLFERLLG